MQLVKVLCLVLVQILLFLSEIHSFDEIDAPCVPRNYGHGSIVCVCNSTYCDTVHSTRPVPFQSVSIYTSTKSGQRFAFAVKGLVKWNSQYASNPYVITLNPNITYQKLKGFGAAITDAASINIKSLSEKAQENLISTYYSSNGIEYNMGRVPMASCDYSTREYTYLDTADDFNLTTFALAKEDIVYKIPVLNDILKLSSKPVSFYASPWTAPAWMKTNNNEIGRGWLKGEAGDKYHKTWAEYFVRFFDEYAKRGVKFWGVTAQNEPSNGLLISSTWQSTGFTAQMQRDFIKTDLGPALNESGYGNLQLMILDDQRFYLPSWPAIILSDKDASKYVAGVGVHWYWNDYFGPELLTDQHNEFPDTFILATEACNEDKPGPSLGNWEDGEKYSSDILDNLNNWAVGWVDWNMCLNLIGGPNWASNFDDSAVIVNATGDEFYKQPMFYHLGHFSKFLTEGSIRIHSSISKSSALKLVAALTPSGEQVLIALNPASSDISVTVVAHPYAFNYTMQARSISTFVWNI